MSDPSLAQMVSDCIARESQLSDWEVDRLDAIWERVTTNG